MMASWGNGVGIVCAPPIGSAPESLAAELECAFLNTYEARSQYAADACGLGGTVRLEVGEDAHEVWLLVHDNGPGLADSERMAVFEPFRSTKGGMGLGLLSVRACTEASNGKLIVGKSPLGGAKFEVRWQKVEKRPSTKPPS